MMAHKHKFRKRATPQGEGHKSFRSNGKRDYYCKCGERRSISRGEERRRREAKRGVDRNGKPIDDQRPEESV